MNLRVRRVVVVSALALGGVAAVALPALVSGAASGMAKPKAPEGVFLSTPKQPKFGVGVDTPWQPK